MLQRTTLKSADGFKESLELLHDTICQILCRESDLISSMIRNYIKDRKQVSRKGVVPN